MTAILFNIHDLSLLLVISECLLLAFLLLIINRGRRSANLLLASFLLCIGIEAFDTLIYWSNPVKAAYFNNSLNLFLFLKFSAFLKGPLLLWYTRSLIHTDFKLKKHDAFHLAPFMMFPLLIFMIFKSTDTRELYEGIFNYGILYQNIFFRSLVLSQNILIVAYCCATLFYFRQFQKQLRNKYSYLERIDKTWLRLLLGGFLFVSFWKLIAPLFHLLSFGDGAHIVGLAGNYLDYFLITALVFYSIAHSDIVHEVSSEDVGELSDKHDNFNEQQVDLIVQAMESQKRYLEPELTLEQLSGSLGISSRLVSNIVNRRFDKNFFEFINFYRVEHAKMLLRKTSNTIPMLEVMADSGFNSKSAFNRFFKKFSGMTPTEFKASDGGKT